MTQKPENSAPRGGDTLRVGAAQSGDPGQNAGAPHTGSAPAGACAPQSVRARLCLLAQKEPSRRAFLLCLFALAAVKLLLAGYQSVYLQPLMAPIDDKLMYDAAVSVAGGQWLGPYNWLTLSKYMLFPVWLAGLHALRVPYLLGGQVLYLAACCAAVGALAPAVRRRTARLALFAVLLFNPAQTAAPVQLRVYRDNLTSALALLLFAGFLGAALRHKQSAARTLPWLLCGGAGLAASWLNREDGFWYLAFCVPATVITLWFICKNRGIPKKFSKCAVHAVPYLLTAAGVLAFCWMNLQFYGRFIVSDFTSVEFKDACGALMRVQAEEPLARVPVTKEVREKLYPLVPELKGIEKELESFESLRDFGDTKTGEYGGGGFYWALRRAVYNSGYADTALEAEQYYRTVAAKVNALCDDGTLPAGRRLSGTQQPVRAAYVLPTLREGAANLGRMLIFAEADPAFKEISVIPAEMVDDYQTFLGETCTLSAQPNTADAYYTPGQQRAYAVLRCIRWLAAAFAVCGFAAGLRQVALGFVSAKKSLRTKIPWSGALVWLIQLGLLLCVLLRCCMVGYLFAASFNPWVGRLMYLCGAHPALLLFCFLGAVDAARAVRRRRRRTL